MHFQQGTVLRRLRGRGARSSVNGGKLPEDIMRGKDADGRFITRRACAVNTHFSFQNHIESITVISLMKNSLFYPVFPAKEMTGQDLEVLFPGFEERTYDSLPFPLTRGANADGNRDAQGLRDTINRHIPHIFSTKWLSDRINGAGRKRPPAGERAQTTLGKAVAGLNTIGGSQPARRGRSQQFPRHRRLGATSALSGGRPRESQAVQRHGPSEPRIIPATDI